MRKKASRLLRTLIGALVGVFLGRALFLYADFCRRPAFYALQSAPWHAALLPSGLFTALLVLIALLLLRLLRARL